jgi:hypothetical protein
LLPFHPYTTTVLYCSTKLKEAEGEEEVRFFGGPFLVSCVDTALERICFPKKKLPLPRQLEHSASAKQSKKATKATR